MSTRNELPGFGPRLKSFREAAELSQGALACAAGTHIDSVAKLEAGTRFPSLELAGRLADALNLKSVAELVPPGLPGSGKKNSGKSAD